MNHATPQVVTFHYHLTDEAGAQIDASQPGSPLAFIAGAGQIIPGLESELIKLKNGEKKKITVDAKDAYGLRDESLIHQVPKTQMPDGPLKVGDMLQTDDGSHSGGVVVIKEITNTHVTVDANHPLAGQNLIFDVEMVGVREATADEISHGHVHGEGGHHH